MNLRQLFLWNLGNRLHERSTASAYEALHGEALLNRVRRTWDVPGPPLSVARTGDSLMVTSGARQLRLVVGNRCTQCAGER
jgi:hypothetical protein